MKKLNMKASGFFPGLLLLLLVAVLLNSCYKDRFGFDKIAGGTWDPTIGAPVINSSLTMDKMTKNDTDAWITYPGGLLGLVYRDSIFSQSGTDIVTFPDQQDDTNFVYRLPNGMSPGDSTSKFFQMNSAISFVTGEILDSLLVKTGVLTVSITTNLNHDGRFEVIIPQLSKYGVNFRGVIPFTYSGGASNTISASFPINLHLLKLFGGSLIQYLKITVIKGNNANLTNYTFDIDESITNISYYEAVGYFHQHTIDLAETEINLDVFETNTIGDLVLEDPRVNLRIFNSYGLPLELTFSKIQAERDGLVLPMTSGLLPTVNLNYPTYQQPFYYTDTTFKFSDANSNVKSLFNLNPKKIVIKGSIKSNPSGNIVPNFVLDTSRIGLMVDVELPLYGKALKFNIVDTTKFSIEDVEELESIDFYINTYNEFPADAALQIYLLDSAKNVVDSLFASNNNIINAALVGDAPDYRTSSKVHKLTVSNFSSAKLRKLDKVNYMAFKATISTASSGTKIVKIYSDYSVDFKVAIKAKLNVEY